MCLEHKISILRLFLKHHVTLVFDVCPEQTNDLFPVMREHSPKKKKYLNKVQFKQTKCTPITVVLSSDSKQTAQQRDQSLDNPFQTSKLLYISKDNKL